jgi:predicted lipoprotein with Yx(FWY)xxD motif
MNRLLTAGAGVVAALAIALAAALAGCGGGSGSSAPSAEANGAATVSAETIGDAGRVLVDSAGKALYAADEEASDMVLCTDACLTFWEPLTVSDGEAPTDSSLPGTLGVAERPDGTRQVTYDGKRLYSFTEDQPGEVTGDGFADAFGGQQFTWHVVHAESGADSPDGGAGTRGGGFDY